MKDYNGADIENVCPRCHSPHLLVHLSKDKNHEGRKVVVDCRTCGLRITRQKCIHDALVAAQASCY